MVTARHATLHECQTVYGVEDVYDMLELMAVEAHNRRAVAEFERRQRER